MAKYSQLRDRVVQSGFSSNHELSVPAAASDKQLASVHDARYVERVKSGSLSADEVRRIGFPWSPQLVERSRRSVGGTIAACRSALDDGASVNLAGGTHHAFVSSGEGFCVLNDAAVAARVMQVEKKAARVAIIDCDVHQGNGTAAIFARDSSVFTFSIHGAANFPFRKEVSDLDIALADGTGDDEYLVKLDGGVASALEASRADLAIYLAGADPYAGDRLGRLSLTKRGLAERDGLVFERCFSTGVPVATVMSGGYADNLSDTVDIHLCTVLVAADYSVREWDVVAETV